MIAGIFHQGSGLGNQLHRYVAARVLALDKGVEFGMVNPYGFKGRSFMNLDTGIPLENFFVSKAGEVCPAIDLPRWDEKKVTESGVDIRGYDPEINFVSDNTIIDGEFQDERYWKHRRKEVDDWLKVDPLIISDNVCIIGFRGGEFTLYPELFLTKDYWDKAIAEMRKINPDMVFRVVTDDPITAMTMFPKFEVTHEIGDDWRSIRYAHNLILSNSSFYILPAWLNEGARVIAPRYWARRNTKIWALPSNYYPQWEYI